MKKNAALLVIALSMILGTILAIAALDKDTKDIEFKGLGFSLSTNCR